VIDADGPEKRGGHQSTANSQEARESMHSETEHEDLRNKSVHLLHEIRQVKYKAGLLAHLAMENEVKEYVAHSVFESFLIHSRVVYEFLFQKRSYQTDIRADDFKEETDYLIPEPDSYLKEWARYMTDKRLMHLTTDRLEVAKHRWEINKIYEPLFSQIISFYRWVPDDHLCGDLIRVKNEDLGRFRALTPGNSFRAPWGYDVIVDTSGDHLRVTNRTDAGRRRLAS